MKIRPATFKKITFPLLLSITLIAVILSSYFRVFDVYEYPLLDLRFKLRAPREVSSDIVLIEIADDSLRNLGKWPLPRDFHASLLDVLRYHGAKTVFFDILFSEPSEYDATLAEAIKNIGNVYLPLAFEIDEPHRFEKGVIRVDAVSADIEKPLESAAKGHGYINVFIAKDGKARAVPVFLGYKGAMVPHLALKAACDYLGYDVARYKVTGHSITIDGKLVLPLSSPDTLLVNYPGKWKDSFLHLSYYDILKSFADTLAGQKPKIDLSVLKGKVCFIGLTATGTSDLRANPLENVYPMLGLQASVFNSIVTNDFVKRVDPRVDVTIIVVLFLLGLLFFLRLPPARGFIVFIALLLWYATTAWILFVSEGLWIDLFLPLATLFLLFLGISFYRFVVELNRRFMLEKELDIARHIQQSFLPKDIAEVAGVHIAALMKPAKFVAGDLYDVVRFSDTQVGILVADVSGKGLPAALIMSQAVSAFRIFSKTTTSPQETMTLLNTHIAGQLESGFITALYIMIDMQKKELTAVSAGHLPLVYYCAGEGKVREIDCKGGPPLGVMAGVEYESETIKNLGTGDILCLYTDGVVEARDTRCNEYGIERLKEFIGENKDADVTQLPPLLEKRLALCTKGAPQHDDITCLAVGL